ncbi:MAG: M28 family peptidase [Candidatus Eisenbacteria bacterium]|uniref:M28 family peptidase n=1 Tax=Eiseniibacteriota bacterium TaxID=2212470 RepID=A0A948RWD5_UNCEI|nr:M28 family peptidase [Candidatus Eisenbacteria bacterium]MBU1947862.1 M28 family peptidase [Candidatus Eisenbacteria bacterium]MBU2690778.1 M28 family peptidase [Candidatus Eisenbacteria bacterium]
MMSQRRNGNHLLLSLLLGSIFLLSGAGAGAEETLLWAPASIDISTAQSTTNLYYNGLSGRLLGAGTEQAAELENRGAVRISAGAEEALFVYLIEDASRAAFEAPARILFRSGHEVLLATDGATPQLTGAADATSNGLKQPVRLARIPITWPAEAAAPRLQDREADPLIQQMVSGLTIASYMSTWQPLEDFVTRYTLAPQNLQASQWILNQFLSFGIDAEFHYFEQSGQRRNVVATIPGQVDPSKVVYITAHFDATSSDPYVCAPGGDDNGSGSAGVIEAARIMSQYLFEYTIKFVCFNGEEQGLYGSSAYVADIAAAGEDVICCYNMDMIAYAGTDPAPPDLIIYTNPASTSVAATLAEAANTYTPGLIEPVIVNESMGSSDHSPFWNHGYQAILAIEEEAWGPDFCPWYHTCNDMIYRYPQDYPTYCAQAVMSAVAMTAIPLNPNGPYLVLNESTLDDDGIAPSNGDGDGIPNPGETIEVWVNVRNVGTDIAQNVSGELSSAGGSVTILTSSAAWNNIPASGQGTNLTAFLIEVSSSAVDGETLPFTLTMTDDSGNRELAFQYTVSAPDLSFYFYTLDDAPRGNGNGVIDPGEASEIFVTIANRGGRSAAGVSVDISSPSGYVNIIEGTAGVSEIPIGEERELTSSFRIGVAAGAPAGEILPLDLAITSGAGYQADSGFKVKVGAATYDELEADGPWSTAAAGDDATSGVWIRVDPNGTLQDTSPCQPEDDHTAAPGTDCFVTGQGPVGGTAGGNDVDGGKTTLTSPLFNLLGMQAARVTYWRWYTNDLGNAPDEDEWVVQVSSNGGTNWVDLERTMQSANSWQQQSFLLDGYITLSDNVQFRFIASDEINGSLVEAAVDDFEITGATASVDVGDAIAPLALRLYPARPSPASGNTSIAFALPTAGRVKLDLYGVDGRHIRSLVNGRRHAGIHNIPWDGAGSSGKTVAPGVYFYRLEAGNQSLVRNLVVIH